MQKIPAARLRLSEEPVQGGQLKIDTAPDRPVIHVRVDHRGRVTISKTNVDAPPTRIRVGATEGRRIADAIHDGLDAYEERVG